VGEAAQELQQRTIDLLLVDFHLADGIDGLQALRQLRSAHGNLPPVAMITADGSSELKQRARALGYPMLHKPVRPAALRALLTALVRQRSSSGTDGIDT
jgi:DNA-binding response OmpR family regulator